MTLNRGADASSWAVSGVFSNLTTGAKITILDDIIFDTSSGYYVLYTKTNPV